MLEVDWDWTYCTVLHFFFSFFYISLLGYAVRHDVICQGNSSVGNLGGMSGMRGCLAGGLGSRGFLELVLVAGWVGVCSVC